MDTKRKVLSEKIFPESTLVEFFIYQYDKETLEVQYRGGKNRVYSGITERDLRIILNSGSVGRALLECLKTKKNPEPKSNVLINSLFDRLRFAFAS